MVYYQGMAALKLTRTSAKVLPTSCGHSRTYLSGPCPLRFVTAILWWAEGLKAVGGQGELREE